MSSPAPENHFQVRVMGSPAPKNDFQVRVKLLYRRAFFLDRAAKPPAPGTKPVALTNVSCSSACVLYL
jgi:hypothetical protein